MTIRIGVEEARTKLDFELVGPKGEGLDSVPVYAVRQSDGWMKRSFSNEEGHAQIEMPHGKITIVAGHLFGPWLETRRTLDVGAKRPDLLRLQLRPAPRLRVDASRVEGLTVVIATDDAYTTVDTEDLESGSIPVPAGEPSTIRISETGDDGLLVRFFDIPPPEERAKKLGENPLVLDWVPEKTVRARLEGPDGKPVAGFLTVVRRELPKWTEERRWGEGEGSREPTTQTRMTGTVTWVVEPEDEKLATRTGTVVLPAGPGDIDLGTIRLRGAKSAPELRIERDDGSTCDEYYVTWRHPSDPWANARRRIEGPGPKESLRIPCLERGCVVTVHTDPGCLPTSLRLEGPPPWRLRIPGGSLTVRVEDENGKALPYAVLLLDGQARGFEELEGGSRRLRRIPAGKHQLIVAMTGYRAKIHELVQRKDEHRSLRVVLRRLRK